MQAISSTRTVAAVSATSAGRYPRTISSCSETTRASISGGSVVARAPIATAWADKPLRCRIVRTSVAACSVEIPGRSRPSAVTNETLKEAPRKESPHPPSGGVIEYPGIT